MLKKKKKRECQEGEYDGHTSNVVLDNLHQSISRRIDDINPIAAYAAASANSRATETATNDVSSASVNKSVACSSSNSPPHERKKCNEIQQTNNENNLIDDSNDHLDMNSANKTHCCLAPMTTISPTVSSTAVATLSTTDLARDQWYAHHVHHPSTHGQHHHHPHPHPHTHPHPHSHTQQLSDEFVMYAPALPTSSTSSPIGKFGIESSTEGYLNARYNDAVFGSNSSNATPLQYGQHYSNSKIQLRIRIRS
uniref:Uncharacterized protein n=1 Tax=Glossina austeni TaxID=7395 RepID=A0A1A9UJQ2_GLOAU